MSIKRKLCCPCPIFSSMLPFSSASTRFWRVYPGNTKWCFHCSSLGMNLFNPTSHFFIPSCSSLHYWEANTKGLGFVTVVQCSGGKLLSMFIFPEGSWGDAWNVFFIHLKLSVVHIALSGGCCIAVSFSCSERCRYTLRGHEDSVNSIEFLPFSSTALTSSADKTLSLWDIRTVSRLCLVFPEFRQRSDMRDMRKMKWGCEIMIESEGDVPVEYSLTHLLSSDQKCHHITVPLEGTCLPSSRALLIPHGTCILFSILYLCR